MVCLLRDAMSGLREAPTVSTGVNQPCGCMDRNLNSVKWSIVCEEVSPNPRYTQTGACGFRNKNQDTTIEVLHLRLDYIREKRLCMPAKTVTRCKDLLAAGTSFVPVVEISGYERCDKVLGTL